MAVGSGFYAWYWHPKHDPDFLIQDFAREARPRAAAARELLITGPDTAALEFYVGRKPVYPPDLATAWTKARAGDVILVSGTHRNPLRREDLPTAPAVNMGSKKAEFVLLEKRAQPHE